MPIFMRILFSAVLLTSCGTKEDAPAKKEAAAVEDVQTAEETKKCLVGYDWIYPSSSNPTGAWKFSSDGTFNSSTTMFGGIST